jgi:hypothetical protein
MRALKIRLETPLTIGNKMFRGAPRIELHIRMMNRQRTKWIQTAPPS